MLLIFLNYLLCLFLNPYCAAFFFFAFALRCLEFKALDIPIKGIFHVRDILFSYKCQTWDWRDNIASKMLALNVTNTS